MALRRLFGAEEPWSGDTRSWVDYQPDETWLVRDHNRSQGYFVNLIAVEAENRARFNVLAGPNKHAIRQNPQIQLHIWKSELRTLVARYSLGEPVDRLGSSFSSLVRSRAALLAHGFDKPAEEAIQLCSLAVLFDDPDAATVLGFLGQRDGFEDMLADMCVAHLCPGSNRSRTLAIPEWHAGLVEVIRHAVAGESRAASERLVRYVEGEWYELHGGPKRAWWYDTHIAGTDYVGYWAWEAAAMARIFGVDDGALNGHPNYPGDFPR